MINQKEKVKLMFDFLQGPIWISDVKTGEPLTGINIIDEDKVLHALNIRCSQLYSECYEFNTDNNYVYLIKRLLRKTKKRFLNYLQRLKIDLKK